MSEMKRSMAVCIASLALAAGLAACLPTVATGQAVASDELVRVRSYGPDVELQVWVDRGEGATYREGEEVRIRFRTSRDCYVVVYDIDTEGYLNLLFPDDPRDDGFVQADHVYRLPHPRARYELLAEGPPGVEYIAAVASVSPIAAMLPWYLTGGYDVHGYRGHYDLEADVYEAGVVRGDPFVAMQDIAYDILPEDCIEREYDTDYTYFHVGRAHSHPRYLCYDCHGRVTWFDPYADACSVFEIRVDLDWHFVSHPTFYYVGPRFWYWRRHDCPPVYVDLPWFWCSLYPRHLYWDYFYDGLCGVGLWYEERGYKYPPPRYRGRPGYSNDGYRDRDPRRRASTRRANPSGKHVEGRTAGPEGRVGGRGVKPSRPGKSEIKPPERLAGLDGERVKSQGRVDRGGLGKRSTKPQIGNTSERDKYGVGKKSGAKGDAGPAKLKSGKRSDRERANVKGKPSIDGRAGPDKAKSKVTVKTAKGRGGSKAKVGKPADKGRSKAKAQVRKKSDKDQDKAKARVSKRPDKSRGKAKAKVNKKSDRSRKKA